MMHNKNVEHQSKWKSKERESKTTVERYDTKGHMREKKKRPRREMKRGTDRREKVKGKNVVLISRNIRSIGPLKALYTFCPPWQTC